MFAFEAFMPALGTSMFAHGAIGVCGIDWSDMVDVSKSKGGIFEKSTKLDMSSRLKSMSPNSSAFSVLSMVEVDCGISCDADGQPYKLASHPTLNTETAHSCP